MNLPKHVLIIIGCLNFNLAAYWLFLTGFCRQSFTFARFFISTLSMEISRA